LLAKKPAKPVILHYHGASSKLQQINFKISMWLFGNRISKIISVSYAGVNQMKKMIKKINADVIYNGVDTNFYKPNLSTKYRKGMPQLLFVSALRKYKNTSFLVKSMKKILEKYPDCNLQIVGYGEDYELLKNLISQLGLEKNVELTGKITDDELRMRYSSCDLYVSASSFEVCPVPPLEAMACGKPILLYDIEPHREIVESSKAGIMFANLSDLEICEAISKIYESKTSYGDLGRKFAEEHDWLSISKQLTKIYEKI
jgi:glycosyltransferase involved in cell wall biosynthesis